MRPALDPVVSMWLDFSRIAAAVVVVLHHVFEPPFHHGQVVFPGRSAVIVFFVISGFVIAYTTDGQADWRRYAVARLARVYSVAVPALVLTTGLVTLQNSLPGLTQIAVDHMGLRLLASAAFVNQFWNLTVAALSNGPYWSLCYEVWYYVLFGVLTYCRGAMRTLLAIGIALLVGPRVLLLLPLWGLGVWTYHLMRNNPLHARAAAPKACFWISATTLIISMVQGTPLDSLTEWIHANLNDGYWTIGHYKVFIGGDARAPADIWLGSLFCLCIYYSPAAFSLRKPASMFQQLVKASSAYTFSLYLYHAPILVFAHAVLAPSLPVAAVPWVMLLIIIAAVVALGHVTELRKEPWARLFGHLLKPCSVTTAK